MKTHKLKCWPEPFRAVADGLKHYEIRKEDTRQFSVGDIAVLHEWKPDKAHKDGGEFTGNWCERKVSYLTRGPDWDVPKGYVVLSLERLPRVFWCPVCGDKRSENGSVSAT